MASLRSALSSVLPRFVTLSLTIPSLNATPFFPRSVDESLQSGALQLPAGTAVLVDESALGEGTLKDAGVRNVHALTKVINEQTLGYVFPFSSFEFETDLKVIVLSRGKSLLPVGLHERRSPRDCARADMLVVLMCRSSALSQSLRSRAVRLLSGPALPNLPPGAPSSSLILPAPPRKASPRQPLK